MATKIRLSNLTQPLDQDLSVPNLTANGSITATGDLNASGMTLTSTYPVIRFIDTNNDPDFTIIGGSGQVGFYDDTNDAYVFQINQTSASVTGDLSVSGNTAITGSLTVDGDVSFSSSNTVGTFNFGDGDKLQFGDSQDLQIHHTGTYSAIQDKGEGALFFGADDFVDIGNSGLSSTRARFYDGTVRLYSNGDIKFETTSTGVSVTGNLDVSANTTLSGLLKLDYLNPRIDFQGDDGIIYRIAVDETPNQLSFGHSSNRAFYVNNTGYTNFNYNVGVAGNLTVTGDFTVSGTTTTIDTDNLAIEDLNITLANGAANSAVADGAGITIDGANATLTYASSGDSFNFNKSVNVDSGTNDVAIVFEDDNVANRYQFTTGGNSLDTYLNINSGTGRASHLRTINSSLSIDIASGFGRNEIRANGATLHIKNDATTVITIPSSGDVDFYENNGGTPQIGMHWDYNDGRLGIGNDAITPSAGVSASAKGIHVAHENVAFLALENTTATTGSKYTLYSNTNGDLVVYDVTDSATRLLIDTDGNVGIGTGNPVYPLEVAANNSMSIAYQRTGVSAKKWGFDSDNASTYWVNITDNERPLTVGNNNRIGINNELNPAYELDVAGDINAQNSFRTDEVRHNVRPSLLLDFANGKRLDSRINFSRGSVATYYDGKTKVKAEENLIPNSSNGGTWTRSRVNFPTTDTTVAPDGDNAQLFTATTESGTHYLPQGALDWSNATRTISIWAKAGGLNFVGVGTYTYNGGRSGYVFNLTDGTYVACGTTGGMTNVSASSQDWGNGWWRLSVTVTATSSSTYPIILLSDVSTTSIINSFTGNNTDGVYLYGFQVEERSELTAYFETTGVADTRYQPTIQSAPSNIPRFDHNPNTGESKGLLVEEARTNYFVYTVPIAGSGQGRWSGNTSFRNNQAIAPDGTRTAAWAYQTASGTYTQSYASLGSTAVRTYAYSFYAKPYTSTCNGIRAYIHESQAGNRSEGIFNFETGSSSATNHGTWTNTSTYMSQVGNGWWRCTIVGTSDGSNSNVILNIRSANTTDINTSNAYYLWGAQLEFAHFSTSHIFTDGATVTRSAENINSTNADFNPKGTFTAFAEAHLEYDNTVTNINATMFSFGPDRIQLRYDDGNGAELLAFTPNLTVNLNNGTEEINNAKTAVQIGQNNFKYSSSGSTTISDSNCKFRPPTSMYIGSLSGSTEFLNGHIQKIAIYNSEFTDAELKALTEE